MCGRPDRRRTRARSSHAAQAADPIDRFFEWFNNERPNIALDMSMRETPAQAYRRKMPKPGDNVKDLEASGAYA